MSLILYDNPDSSNALKVRLLLAELQLDYEQEIVDMARPRPEQYVLLNPLTGIPTLTDGDFVVTESHVILRYLAEREERPDLYGFDLAERARVNEFLDRFATRLRSPLFRHEAAALGFSLATGFDPDNSNPESAAEIETELQDHLALLDSLVGSDFVVLNRLTLADFALAPILHRTSNTGLSLTNFSNLESLKDSLLARPGWMTAAGPGV